eukprot:1158325-Pelagomonas_calceolata.AAC.17
MQEEYMEFLAERDTERAYLKHTIACNQTRPSKRALERTSGGDKRQDAINGGNCRLNKFVILEMVLKYALRAGFDVPGTQDALLNST